MHIVNALRQYYSKTLHMMWRKCRLSGNFQASGLFTGYDIGYKNQWLISGKIIHGIADQIHDMADLDIMRSFYTKDQVLNYIHTFFNWEYWADYLMYIPYVEVIVHNEADRWMTCMQMTEGGIEDIIKDWYVPYREIYVEREDLNMALNVDRLEKVPGTDNCFALMEFKKIVRSNIRQELAWYYIGLEEWAKLQHYCPDRKPWQLDNYDDPAIPTTLHYHCGDNDCAQIGIEITHWGAVGFEDPRTSFYSKVSKMSLTTMRKHIANFREDMAGLHAATTKQAKLLYMDKHKATRLMPNLWCRYCNFQSTCYQPVHFEAFGEEYGELKTWEKRKREKLLASGTLHYHEDKNRSFTETL